ncbi:PREDICTED: ergothioneine biosynthesis protein 1-like [Branchiostoma belcheri]|uniref:Ergothioneine biosynthesis protein 1-like n=1 Tax=Branchiostoma belcheri TaxID=7741 RepID=A0A6P5AQZ6_BRABE|nr:PREDICTED: ergothioneine biosynthesis protein 1-like [Branchiostoma belcheri]
MMATTHVLTGKYRTTGMAPLDLSSCSKGDILKYFEASYDLNESLFVGLKDEEAFYKCPDRLRLPLIFYYAHTATVYVNKLMLAGLMTQRVNLHFETMFELGVDEMSWDDTENYRMGGSFQWPPLAEAVEFRRLVRNRVRQLIEDTPLQLPITQDSPWWAVMMGVEHEKIHIETSSVLIRQMPITMVTTPPKWKYAPASTDTTIQENPLIQMEGGEVTIGKPRDFPSYGWCMEYGQRTFKVPTFEASKFKVTNREILQFVKAGGYENSSYWTKEGWTWQSFRQLRHPVFWVCTKGCKSGCGAALSSHSHCLPEYFTTTYSDKEIRQNSNGPQHGDLNGTRNGPQNGDGCLPDFRLRVMFDVIEMPWDWPAVVNYHEARAFCAWKGSEFRMLTEAEFNMIQGGALGAPSKGVTSDPVFHKDPQANFRLTFGSSSPVDLYPANDLGFHDVYGNVWEWVEDHFNGLPGYKQHHLYDDYAFPFMDGRHGLMLGGSWASDGTYNSRFSRSYFRRHFYQHAGFRVARTLPGAGKSPVVMVNTDVYILGAGVEEKQLTVPETVGLEVVPMASTNKQFHQETEEQLAAMLALQYGNSGQNYSKDLADFCVEKANLYGCPLQNVVQLGCGTGGVVYQLARTYKEVIGLDYCARFLDAAITLQKNREFHLPRAVTKTEKSMTKDVITVSIPADMQRNRLTFKQMTWVPNEIPKANLVLLDFLDRVNNPKAWWLRLWEIVTDNGIVVVISQKVGKDELAADLNKKMDLLDEQEFQFNNGQGQTEITMATIWKLRV